MGGDEPATYSVSAALVRRLPAWLAVAILFLASCGDPQRVLEAGAVGVNARAGDVLLRNVYVDEPRGPVYRPGEDARVWLRLINQSASQGALVEVRSAAAREVEIRWDSRCDGHAERVSGLPLRPTRGVASKQTSAPAVFGAYHLKLVGLRERVLAGDSVRMQFVFQRQGRVTVDVLVEPSNAQWVEPTPLCSWRLPDGPG